MSLPLNQKLERITFREEVTSKAKIAPMLGLLHQIASQVVKPKEKFLKKISSAIPANPRMARKQNSRVAGTEKVLVVWRDQSSHNVPLN